MGEGKTFQVVGTDISDGYHTFDELYAHRFELWIALCRRIPSYRVWRSQNHGDGSMYTGWFVMGIDRLAGEQATYHLPLDRWNDTNFAETLDRAPLWDGHTPADVLERLKRL